MTVEPPATPQPWQPLTLHGIARFAHARTGRFLLIQFLTGLICGGAMIWFLALAFVPRISEAVQRAPETARLTSGVLTNMPSGLLSDGRVLSLSVQLEGSRESGTGDIRVIFESRGASICSLLGCLWLEYPAVSLPLGRSASEPWWGAWHPVILAGCGLLAAVLLMCAWSFLALIYMWPARLFGYFADRNLSNRGAWQLATAAQFPAALLMIAGLVLYGAHALDLVQVIAWFGFHLLLGASLTIAAVYRVPRVPGAVPLRQNPFKG